MYIKFINIVQSVVNMDKIKSVTWMAIRTYARKRSTGARAKLSLLDENERNMNIEDADVDDFDFDDIGEHEPDITQAHIYHKMHEREQYKTKEMLKKKITATKYFKVSRPNFLTFVEKEQIRMLHETNPNEWTIEKLSAGFPALPSTIAKILKAKWHPKSVDKILKQDTTVAENWKMFRAGKLAVDLELRTHLMKFKDRQIILTDRETLAKKLVPPKIEFPKPKSTMFSKIVEGYITEKGNKQIGEEKSLCVSQPDTPMKINLKNQHNETNDRTEILNFNTTVLPSQFRSNLVTFSDFGKQQLNKPFEGPPEEAITLVNVYKKQMADKTREDEITIDKPTAEIMKDEVSESTLTREMAQANMSVDFRHQNISEDIDADSFNKNNKISSMQTNSITTFDNNTEVFLDKKSTQTLTNPSESNISSISNIDETHIISKKDKGNNELSTYVVAWHKKTEDNVDYTLPIQIPKRLYKEGKMYRVKDCYYDDNGEFLFRVPGLKG